MTITTIIIAIVIVVVTIVIIVITLATFIIIIITILSSGTIIIIQAQTRDPFSLPRPHELNSCLAAFVRLRLSLRAISSEVRLSGSFQMF